MDPSNWRLHTARHSTQKPQDSQNHVGSDGSRIGRYPPKGGRHVFLAGSANSALIGKPPQFESPEGRPGSCCRDV